MDEAQEEQEEQPRRSFERVITYSYKAAGRCCAGTPDASYANLDSSSLSFHLIRERDTIIGGTERPGVGQEGSPNRE